MQSPANNSPNAPTAPETAPPIALPAFAKPSPALFARSFAP